MMPGFVVKLIVSELPLFYLFLQQMSYHMTVENIDFQRCFEINRKKAIDTKIVWMAVLSLVDPEGFEPLTSALRTQRSPS